MKLLDNPRHGPNRIPLPGASRSEPTAERGKECEQVTAALALGGSLNARSLIAAPEGFHN